MAVKVGASLWTATADQQRAPVRETHTRDFERKIGLRDHSSTSNESAGRQSNEHVISEQRLPYSEFPEADLARIVRPGSGDASESRAVGTLELYALGAHAGHHLSYLSQIILADQGRQGVASGGVELGYSESLNPLPIASTISLMPSAALIKSPDGSWGEPVEVERQEVEDSASRQLLSYFTWKWPDRHFQFLPRGNGLELLVRDYRLTPQERDELIDELSRRASSMPECPQQIWLNGEEVWRASSLSNDYKGEHNGR
ncbi:hypothetical protein [Pseudomonas sp. GM48]|uniref:hypothetical protein n=1 Tax=Pseudomonas sp. GM48 TaxID=1144330 RepID=UPI00026FEEB6|nr:hypothetical protein [Pseudomonas sp. GM48]EJM54444.1 hypothetical protein PMI28_03847 [Pseudomonas sp. GM48]